MGSTQFGNFGNFCRDSTLPVCNIFTNNQPPNAAYGGCALTGIPLSDGRYLANLGSILFAAVGIALAGFLIILSERKKAAVGRREMQLFLGAFILVQISEIFTIGGIPYDDTVRKGFTAVHLGLIAATTWLLLLNAIVGYQLLDDGTPISIGLFIISALILFVGTGYISLDTAFGWTGYFDPTFEYPNRHIALYVLYLLFPLVCIVGFFVLESVLVLHTLGERRPMIYLAAAALLFAVGQIFQFVASTHICEASNGRINGAMFETFFTVLSVGLVWVFWSSITEDDWSMPPPSGGYN